MHQYKTEQFLPISSQEAWDFFSSPENLSRITPPELDFKIISKLNGEKIYKGMKIEYSVKPLFGIPLHWQTEISAVDNQNSFSDKQVKGPYKAWEHIHTFTEMKEGVLMRDEVNYKLPLGLLGNLIHSILVKKKIESIFAFRKQVMEKMFINNGKNRT